MSENTPVRLPATEGGAAPLPPSPVRRPVVVGGCPRSGTTLLRTMLDSHPHLAVPHETRFVVPAWRRRDLFGDLTRPDNRRDVARWVLSLPKSRFARIGIPADDLIEAFADSPPTLGSLMETCFSLYAEREGKQRWGDKRPSYAQNLDAVFGLFPNAQFVNIVRDPRACVASMRRIWTSWGRLPSAVEVWERTDKAVRAAVRKHPPDQVLQVRYEDLVADPESTLRELCRFLALDPARIPDMLAYHTGDRLPEGWLHENVGKPVTAQPLHRWTTELDDMDVAFIEHVLAARLDHYGYARTTTGARVSEAELAELGRLRSKRDRRAQRVRLVELKRRFTYRCPTAAESRV